MPVRPLSVSELAHLGCPPSPTPPSTCHWPPLFVHLVNSSLSTKRDLKANLTHRFLFIFICCFADGWRSYLFLSSCSNSSSMHRQRNKSCEPQQQCPSGLHSVPSCKWGCSYASNGVLLFLLSSLI